MLQVLHEDFRADFGVRTNKGLTVLHCAAQQREGVVPIFYLKDVWRGFDPNAEDEYGATPLHYAIMSIEENNIQALISLGADVNHQDHKGQSILHIAVARYVENQDDYAFYKEILKEML